MSLRVHSVIGLVTAAFAVVAVSTAGAASAEPVVGPTPNAASTLTLINGWTTTPFGTHTPAISNVNGVAVLQGAISTSGSSAEPFVLPSAFRPTATVYVPVDLCNATNGRLVIAKTGDVTVEAGTNFANAQCFTSLEGASFPLTTTGFTALTPLNGWTSAPFATRKPAVETVDGVVHFKGAVGTGGTNSTLFVLPKAFRPGADVYVKADLCNATNGRLLIEPSGNVSVESEGDFSNAQCFVSLEGISYGLKLTGSTPVALINGWSGAPFGTRAAAARVDSGKVVHLQGAISAPSGSTLSPFVLATAFRPTTTVYAPVDTCGATNGRLVITSDGAVTIQVENDASNATCFVSLDGVQFKR